MLSLLKAKKSEIIVSNVPQKTIIKSGRISYSVYLVKHLRGGKSGDSVILMKDNVNKLYVLKIFTPGNESKTEKNNNEILYHLKFMSMFSNKYMPVPIIYMYGIMKGENPFGVGTLPTSGNMYVIMEALNPPYELHDYIEAKCKNIPAKYDIDLYNIIIQIFYIITKMQMNNLLHCDLHSKNIMLVPMNKNVTINFNHLQPELSSKIRPQEKYTFKKYMIKIIDFGEGSKTICRKSRSISGALVDLNRVCGISIITSSIVALRGELFGIEGNPDINFFIRIVELANKIQSLGKTLGEQDLKIDVNKLWEISKSISTINTRSMNAIVLLKMLDILKS